MTQWQAHNQEAEENFIGAVFKLGVDSDKLAAAFGQLRPEDFYNPKHQKIFKLQKQMYYNKHPIDLLTMSDTLKGDSLTFIGSIIQSVHSAANISGYARLIKERALERTTLAKLNESIAVLTGLGETKEKTSQIVNLLSTIEMDTSIGAGGVTHIRDIAMNWIDVYEDRINNPNAAGISTNIQGIDKIFGARGVNKTDLIVIGARPKMGKTQLAITIADHVAKDLKKTVMIFSMEMANGQVSERFLSHGSKVSTDNFYGRMCDDKYAMVNKAISELIDTKIYIDDHTNMSLSHIRSECRKMKAKNGEIGAIFIDYLTLMKAEKADRNDLAYGLITKGLKDMAKDLRAPVFLLAQLSRGVDSRQDKRPLMSDLRETGQIEQDADRIIFLYSESAYNPDCGLGGLTELNISANRHGPTGRAYVDMVNGIMIDIDENQVNERFSREQSNSSAPKKLAWSD